MEILNEDLKIKKGQSVPKGAVNLAWAEAPKVDPTSQSSVVNSGQPSVVKGVLNPAFANAQGILEDEFGAQVWPDEFPVITDVFNDVGTPLSHQHISRYFHIESVGLAYPGSLSEYSGSKIKVFNGRGEDHLDENGNKLYKVFLSAAQVDDSDNVRNELYRVHVFFEGTLEFEDLFVHYVKGEYNKTTDLVDSIDPDYYEPVNDVGYYAYTPEESEVIDPISKQSEVYSSTAAGSKAEIIDASNQVKSGWTYHVPKKSIPDPRNYEVFRWRLACQLTKRVDASVAGDRSNDRPDTINAGLVTFNSPNSSGRASILFDILNTSEYKSLGSDFQNPLSEDSLDVTNEAYWSVPFFELTVDQLKLFDVLVWAPYAGDITISEEMVAKIDYFTKTLGGTFIIETSSKVQIAGIPEVTFTVKRNNLASPDSVSVRASTVDYFDNSGITADEDSVYGAWQIWPPNVETIWTGRIHTNEVLQNGSFLGGYTLNTANELTPSVYNDPDTVTGDYYLQYITGIPQEAEVILDAIDHGDGVTRRPVLIRRNYQSGGSLYVGTAGTFESHYARATGSLVVPQVGSRQTALKNVDLARSINSNAFEGEMKLRYNIMYLANAFRKPETSNNVAESDLEVGNDYSATIYTDWQSSWVINAHDGVLDDVEKGRFNFALLPPNEQATEPVWMRILSDKTMRDLIVEKANDLNDPKLDSLLAHYDNLERRYTIIVTNPRVQTIPVEEMGDDTTPAAWTLSFSPKFIVPADVGPHIVREEIVEEVNEIVAPARYPPQEFALQSMAKYRTAEVEDETITVQVSLTGTATRTYRIPDKVIEIVTDPPASSGIGPITGPATVSSDATAVRSGVLAVAERGGVTGGDVKLTWKQDGAGRLALVNSTTQKHMVGHWAPVGVETWSDANYNIRGTSCYPYWGMRGVLKQGSRGDQVRILQMLLNQAIFMEVMTPDRFLKEDGIFGPQTRDRVTKFQQNTGARFVNGSVDAETWGILGNLLLMLYDFPVIRNHHYGNNTEQGKYIKVARNTIHTQNLVDGNPRVNYYRQSSYQFNVAKVSETFKLTFDTSRSKNKFNDQFRLSELIVLPMAPEVGNSSALNYTLDWLDVGVGINLRNYHFNKSRASHGPVNYPLRSGKYATIPFSPRRADTIVFRISTTAPAGWGQAKVLGITDMFATGLLPAPDPGAPPQPPPKNPTTTTVVIPGRTVTERVPVSAKYVLNLKSGVSRVLTQSLSQNMYLNGKRVSSITGAQGTTDTMYPAHVSNLRFTSISITPSAYDTDITATQVSSGGDLTYSVIYHGYTQSAAETNYLLGPELGGGSEPFYFMSPSGTLGNYERTEGWIRKDQGIQLLADANGKPVGFPISVPEKAVGEESAFSRLSVHMTKGDQNISYGFYDIQEQSWVGDADGVAELSYLDYIRRGRQNVFIGVRTSQQIDGGSVLSQEFDIIKRPLKIAMPSFGVKTEKFSNIQLERIDPDLSIYDPWPLFVTVNSFTKEIVIPSNLLENSSTSWSAYAGQRVKLVYNTRELNEGPWSDLLGKPYTDIKDEHPEVLDSQTLKVNFGHIASRQEPTVNQFRSDPVKYFFKVEMRADKDSPWSEMPISDIQSINATRGIIKVNPRIYLSDPELVRVSYTSKKTSLRVRKIDGDRINLNPLMMKREKPEWLNVRLYVYLKPAYVLDTNSNILHQSPSAVGITTNQSLFDETSPQYDPTLHRLGYVYVSDTVDIDDMRLVDSRLRGGGLTHHDQVSEDFSLWDSRTQKPFVYQRGGFLMVNLPNGIDNDFSDEEIEEVIRRNVAAGVAFDWKVDSL